MLDESLATPSRMFEFVFRMFADGDVAVPAEGMSAIARQLADRLGIPVLPNLDEALRRDDVHIVSICAEPIAMSV